MSIFVFPSDSNSASQEFQDGVLQRAHGDRDGWVRWADHPPRPDVDIEVRLEGDDEVRVVTPREWSMKWNVAGVWWRLPK